MNKSFRGFLVGILITLPQLAFGANAEKACAFEGWDLYSLKNSSEFAISQEVPAPITSELYWTNEFFFQDFRRVGCRGAWRTALVTDLRDGRIYRYYRTVEDNCDGGNTNGIFLEEAVSLKAIAVMNDSDISCRE